MAKGKFSAPRSRFSEPTAAPEAPVSRKTSKKKISGKPVNKKVWQGICAGVLVLCLAVGGWFAITAMTDPYDCRIVENVHIGGVDVGGMTRRDAKNALEAALADTLNRQPLTVVLPAETLTLSPAEIQPEVDVGAAVKAAYRLGRKEALPEGEATLSLLPYLRYNKDALDRILQSYADRYDTDLVPYSYELTGQMPELAEDRFDADAPAQFLEITRGIPDVHLDTENLLNKILECYGSAPGLCRAGGYSISHHVPTQMPELPELDAILEEFSIAPVDADVSFETYQPVPGSYGYTFDISTARRLMNHAEPGQTVFIPMEYVEPEILRDEVFFRDVLGSCETKHTKDENRNTNLRLLCEALDGLVLEPGQEFSFNDSVGQRTRERGYLPAGAYSGTVLIKDVGGGVCQGSTTLYNCVLLADLEVIFRVNHGYAVSYVPYGLDATVNWGGPDFQFRNSSHFPIKITAEVSDGYVKMKLLGTDEKDYYVVMESEYGSSDVAIYSRSYKCKYDKETGELISRELEARSNYMK